MANSLLQSVIIRHRLCLRGFQRISTVTRADLVTDSNPLHHPWNMVMTDGDGLKPVFEPSGGQVSKPSILKVDFRIIPT